jgi:hypothetical protein
MGQLDEAAERIRQVHLAGRAALGLQQQRTPWADFPLGTPDFPRHARIGAPEAKLRAQATARRLRRPPCHTCRGTAPPLVLPPPLSQLPWDLAQDEFGVAGAWFAH